MNFSLSMKKRFRCECQLYEKIGIACEHLFRVFKEENVNILEYINGKYKLNSDEKVIEID